MDDGAGSAISVNHITWRRITAMRHTIIAVCLLILFGCGPSVDAPHVLTLHSGKTVQLSVGMMYASSDDNALMVTYQTDTPIYDHERLAKEADEIWESLRASADKAHLVHAILSAHAVPTVNQNQFGITVTRNSGYNFDYRVGGGTGTWARMN